jgi:NTE family protein
MFHNAIIGIPTILSALTLHEPKIRHIQKPQSETVLVMQGGGSLGAYEWGVFKTLTTHGIKFDIVAGTSIGAITVGIVAGSRSDHPEKHLEAFWLDLAETITPTVLPDYTRAVMSSSYSVLTRMPSGIGTH